MCRRRRPAWCLTAAVLTVGWFVVPAVGNAGSTPTHAQRVGVGAAIFAVWITQLIVAFTAPRVELDANHDVGRARWLWLAVLPGGLGSWVPILAGIRARIWWWVVLGCACEGSAIYADTQVHTASGSAASIRAGALLVVGWGGGIVTSVLIRPVYERRVLGRERKRNWPKPTELARSLGARYALIAWMVLLGAVFAIVAIANALGGQLPRAIAPLAFDLLLLGSLLPLIRSRGLRWRDLGIRSTLPPAAGYAVLALLGYSVAAAAWILIISPESSSSAATKLVGAPHQPSAAVKILLAFALAVSAPICEELFFRGLLYRALRNLMPLWPAALIAGTLFGLGHLAGYPLNTIPVKIVFGVLMCLLYERTGSLLPCIAVHSFVDGAAVNAALTGNDDIALIAAALLLLLVGAIALRRRRTAPPDPRLTPGDLTIATAGVARGTTDDHPG